MANYKSNELFGAVVKLVEFLETNSAALTAKGANSATMVTAVNASKGRTVTAENTQEALKGQLKTATTTYETEATGLVDLMTSTVDMAAGALGKKTALGKQALNIRKQLNKLRGSTGSGGQTS